MFDDAETGAGTIVWIQEATQVYLVLASSVILALLNMLSFCFS